MKLVLLMAMSLAMVGVTVISTADEAAACIPPNCPGFGKCYVEEHETDAHIDAVIDEASVTISTYSVECYY